MDRFTEQLFGRSRRFETLEDEQSHCRDEYDENAVPCVICQENDAHDASGVCDSCEAAAEECELGVAAQAATWHDVLTIKPVMRAYQGAQCVDCRSEKKHVIFDREFKKGAVCCEGKVA